MTVACRAAPSASRSQRSSARVAWASVQRWTRPAVPLHQPRIHDGPDVDQGYRRPSLAAWASPATWSSRAPSPAGRSAGAA
jgi:hypothetical protein